MHKLEKLLIIIALLLLVVIVTLTVVILNMPTKTTSSPLTSPTEVAKPQPAILEQQNLTSPNPSSTPKPPLSTKTYTGTHLTFTYRSDWNPINQPLAPGSVKEVINLGIPETTDHTVAFTPLTLDQIKPNDIQEESDITIDGQQGKKWIRHGEGYFSYDYYTKDPNSSGSFGIHVTTSEREAELEKQLDELIKSIKFKQ